MCLFVDKLITNSKEHGALRQTRKKGWKRGERTDRVGNNEKLFECVEHKRLSQTPHSPKNICLAKCENTLCLCPRPRPLPAVTVRTLITLPLLLLRRPVASRPCQRPQLPLRLRPQRGGHLPQIATLLVEEIRGRSHLHSSPGVHDHNTVIVDDGVEAMRDRDHR